MDLTGTPADGAGPEDARPPRQGQARDRERERGQEPDRGQERRRDRGPVRQPGREPERTYWLPPARLALAAATGRTPLRGAWWPRCDLLELELPSLVGALGPGVGTVTGVTVDAVAWPGVPRTVATGGGVIDVALSAVDAEAHAIALDCGAAGHWELLVVPPGESAAAAHWLLRTAADPHNTLTAAHMLALVESGFQEPPSDPGSYGGS